MREIQPTAWFAVIFLTSSGISWTAIPSCHSKFQNRRTHVGLNAKKNKKKKNSGASTARGKRGFGSFGNKSEESLAARAIVDDIAKEPSITNLHPKEAPTLGLTEISSSPLLFTFDHFMDPELCMSLSYETSEAFCLSFRQKVAKLLFVDNDSTQPRSDCPHDGMKFNLATSRDANNDATMAGDHATTTEQRTTFVFPDGVHMDTNNECIFRHLTAILYLNDVPIECGGATVFPLARALDNDPVLQASQRLLQAKIGHTRSCGVVRKRGIERQADAVLLEYGNRDDGDRMINDDRKDGTAICVQPQAGKLLLFFSRTCAGEEDPRAWHGGERLHHGIDNVTTEKRLLTLFKQVDYGSDDNEQQQPTLATSTFEQYLSHQIQTQSSHLRELSSCVS